MGETLEGDLDPLTLPTLSVLHQWKIGNACGMEPWPVSRTVHMVALKDKKSKCSIQRLLVRKKQLFL